MSSKNLLDNIRVILVEPAGTLNVGSVSRVMKNMGLSNLVLVNPKCDYLSPEALQMSVHADDVLLNAKIVSNLSQALEGVTRAIATTVRSRSIPTILESPRKALPWLLANKIETALIFGPEERGLSNQELNYAQRYVYIQANPDYPSLNLAQAVAICAYELYQIVFDDEDVKFNQDCENVASLDLLDSYYQHLETTLLNIGYLYSHTAKARMEKLRRLFNKSSLSPEEVNILRGILSQIEWYGQQKSK
jgi:tRNA/rRNA methyltransferase